MGSIPRSLRASICSVTFMLPTSAVIAAPTFATSKSAGNRDSQFAQDELSGESRNHRHGMKREIHMIGDFVGDDHPSKRGRDRR